MPADSRHDDLPVAVQDRPHWRIVIHPTAFKRERIPTLKECWQLVEGCNIAFRGWDYPHVDSRNQASGTDWIASWSQFEGHLEYWRMFQSAQFVHLLAFREDGFRKDAEQRARMSILDLRDGTIQPSGYLDVTSTIYTLTEIYEFAARLAGRGALGDAVTIGVEMHGVRDRALFAMDPQKAWWHLYQATEDELVSERRVDVVDLATRSTDLARDACLWFFERFQWYDPSTEMIAAEQQRLIERRF